MTELNELNDIRKPAAAGSFYPVDPLELSQTLARLFSEVEKKPISGRPVAIIAPHAGYTYSGKTAVEAYKLLEGEEYDTVVVISPSHTVFFQGASIYNGDAYETPLGLVEVDQDISAQMSEIHPLVFFSNKGHTGGSVRGEHALEVHLPFLQHVLGKFKLVAIVMGDQEDPTCRALGEVMATTLKNKNCLIVASTDLSHFHHENEARKLDGKVQEAITQYNPGKLMGIIGAGAGEACGGGSVASTLMATRRLGGKEIAMTGYTTSGEATGDFDEVVGYLSAVIVGDKKAPRKNHLIGSPAKKQNLELSDEDKEYLLDLAKRAIVSGIKGVKLFEKEPESKMLIDNKGAFVTIKIGGDLRGCIGLIRAAKPLYETVIEMAQAAALEDPRFVPLTEADVDKIEIEISALSRLYKINHIDEFKAGRDGLMISLDMHSGLLLPQVALENNWDNVVFIEQVCLKAGLPKNSYKDKSAKIFRFTADVF